MSKENTQEIDLLSETADEILGSVPPWIVRWGITVIFISVIIIIGFSLVIKYPDQITCKIAILSENPPSDITAKTGGKIQYLFVKNGEYIQVNQRLSVLESTANYADVQELKIKIDSIFNYFQDRDLKLPALTKIYSLGTLQPNYINFNTQYQEFKNFLKSNSVASKISSINARIRGNDLGLANQINQLNNLVKITVLAHKKFTRDSTLFAQKVITAVEVESSQQTYLSAKNNLEQLKASINNLTSESSELQFEILNLKEQNTEKVNQYINTINGSLKTLQNAITEWEKQYVLVSPIAGKVAFTKYWSTNQNVTIGTNVFTVVPTKLTRIIGRIQLPVAGSGKVRVGQAVNVMVDNYPYTEYGVISAVVESIALIPENENGSSFYTIKVVFPNQLITSYHQTLPFSQQMQGTAEIITRKLTLFDRVTQQLRATIDKHPY